MRRRKEKERKRERERACKCERQRERGRNRVLVRERESAQREGREREERERRERNIYPGALTPRATFNVRKSRLWIHKLFPSVIQLLDRKLSRFPPRRHDRHRRRGVPCRCERVGLRGERRWSFEGRLLRLLAPEIRIPGLHVHVPARREEGVRKKKKKQKNTN